MTQLQNPADAIVKRPIETLIPYARNSRIHSDEQVSQIMASIKEWGWTNPVLIAEDGTIIAGHGRVMAAQRLGLDEVPCVVASGWTPAQIKAYVIADNKLALNASWDERMLRIELEELAEEDESLVGLIGFSDAELSMLMEQTIDEVDAPESFKEVDEDIETDKECPSCGYRWS